MHELEAIFEVEKRLAVGKHNARLRNLVNLDIMTDICSQQPHRGSVDARSVNPGQIARIGGSGAAARNRPGLVTAIFSMRLNRLRPDSDYPDDTA